MGLKMGTDFIVRGLAGPAKPMSGVAYQTISPAYFATMGTRVLSGRDFTAEDRKGAPCAVIVNESLARQAWPAANPLMGSIVLDGLDCRVVGVVQDVREISLVAPGESRAYFSAAQRLESTYTLLVKTDGRFTQDDLLTHRVLETMRPLQAHAMLARIEDVMRRTMVDRYVVAFLMAGLAGMTFAFAFIGVYALASHTVADRKKEVAIRLCLGATRGAILLRLLAVQLNPVIVGLVIGAGLAILLGQVLTTVNAQAVPLDLRLVVGLTTGVFLIAVIAALIPIRRATTMKPADLLRVE
jgi:hypothetical protein